MAAIQMKYNPYKVTTSIVVNGVDLMQETKLSKFQGTRLQVWIEELFLLLEEICNENHFDICFTGMLADFEDIVAVSEQYLANSLNASISLNHVPVEEMEDKFTELEHLVDMMQTGPFEELHDEKIRANFEKALNSEFEIAVIATMSSGKSTLINSFLGKDLMPSKNEACTAKISRIRNNPHANGYSAVAYKSELKPTGEEIYVPFKSIEEASLKDFEEFNDDPAIDMIEIDGSIPSISSGKMNLVLVDTPGPNNSMDGSHREHTLKVIKSDDKPMVLYVLNATQLRTDDDYRLLKEVASAMAVGGKQSKDRFIFAVNKADTFDPELGEDLGKAIENVRVYLEQQGIQNPNIYPISAQTAKVIRKSANDEDLTRQEKKALSGIDLFLEEESMHLNEYAPLSRSLKNKIQQKINEANATGNEEDEALYYSGIPSVEAAINEYLEKYAVTSKITNAVNTFKRIVEQKQFMQNLQQSIAENAEVRKMIGQAMERIEDQLAQGNRVEEFKSKIYNMDFDTSSYFRELNKKIFAQEINTLTEKLRVGKVEKYKAEALMYKLKKDIDMLQDSATVDIENVISTSLRTTGQTYLQEYQAYVKDLLDFGDVELPIEDWDRALVNDTPDVDELLADFSYEEEVFVGTREVKNEKRKWYKPWTLITQDKYIEEDIYDSVEYVDMNELAGNYLEPIIESLQDNFESAQAYMETQLKALQVFFIQKIDELDAVMQERIQEIKQYAQQTEVIEQEMAQQQAQKKWLEEFTNRLDDILELKEKDEVIA